MLVMNKKGHIPTILLLVFALILVITALYTFFVFNGKVGASSFDISRLSIDFESDEQYVYAMFDRLVGFAALEAAESGGDFEGMFRVNFESMANEAHELSGVSGNFFGEIRNHRYDLNCADSGLCHIVDGGVIEGLGEEDCLGVGGIWESLDKECTIGIEEVFVISEVGDSRMERTFDLEVDFNENGLIQ